MGNEYRGVKLMNRQEKDLSFWRFYFRSVYPVD